MIAVIGYGNLLRRDDGAGLVLAAMLADSLMRQDRHLCRFTAHQLTPELAMDLSAPDIRSLVFADARVADVAGAEVRLDRLGPPRRSVKMGHHLEPETLLALVSGIFDRDVPAWVASAPGWDFGYGEGISARTRAALVRFEAHIDAWTRTIFDGVAALGMGMCQDV